MSDTNLSEVELSALRGVVERWDEAGGLPVQDQEIEQLLGLNQWDTQVALQGLVDRRLITLANFGDNRILSVGFPTGEARALLR